MFFLKILSCVNIDKTLGMDKISAKLVKEAADILTYPFYGIINF